MIKKILYHGKQHIAIILSISLVVTCLPVGALSQSYLVPPGSSEILQSVMGIDLKSFQPRIDVQKKEVLELEARSEEELAKILNSFDIIRKLEKPVRVTYIMPMYNEERRLMPKSEFNPYGEDALRKKIKQLQDLHALNPNFEWRLIVVDDGSPTEACYECAKDLWEEIQNEEHLPSDKVVIERITPERKKEINSRKGGAVYYGIQKALDIGWADYIGYTDVDTSIDMRLTGNLLDALINRKADVAIGSRWCKGADRKGMPLQAYLSSIGFDWLVRKIIPPLHGIKDTQRGFKLFDKKALAQILPFARERGFAFDVELLLLSKLAGFTVKEVPVSWFESRKASTLHLFSDARKMFKSIRRFRRHFKWRKVATVFVWDEQRGILLTRRNQKKKFGGGKWEAGITETLEPDDDYPGDGYEKAAIRGLMKNLNLEKVLESVDPKNLIQIGSKGGYVYKHWFRRKRNTVGTFYFYKLPRGTNIILKRQGMIEEITWEYSLNKFLQIFRADLKKGRKSRDFFSPQLEQLFQDPDSLKKVYSLIGLDEINSDGASGKTELSQTIDELSGLNVTDRTAMTDNKLKISLPPYKILKRKNNIISSIYLAPKSVRELAIAFKEKKRDKIVGILDLLEYEKQKESSLAWELLSLSLLSIYDNMNFEQASLIVDILEKNTNPVGIKLLITKAGLLKGAHSARYNVKPAWIVIDGKYVQALNKILSISKQEKERKAFQDCGFGKKSDIYSEVSSVVGHLFAERWLIHEGGHKDVFDKNEQLNEEKRVAQECEYEFFKNTSSNMITMIDNLFYYLDHTGRTKLKSVISASKRFEAFAEAETEISGNERFIDDFVKRRYPTSKNMREEALAMVPGMQGTIEYFPTVEEIKMIFRTLHTKWRLFENYLDTVKGKSGRVGEGYHRYEPGIEVAYLAYLIGKKRSFSEFELIETVVAAALHDFDIREAYKSADVQRTIEQIKGDDELLRIVRILGIDIPSLYLLIERTEHPWDSTKQRAWEMKLKNITNIYQRKSVKERAEILQFLNKASVYLCLASGDMYLRIADFYKEKGWDDSPEAVVHKTLSFIEQRLKVDVQFKGILEDLPGWSKKNWENNIGYLNTFKNILNRGQNDKIINTSL